VGRNVARPLGAREKIGDALPNVARRHERVFGTALPHVIILVLIVGEELIGAEQDHGGNADGHHDGQEAAAQKGILDEFLAPALATREAAAQELAGPGGCFRR
jgi:hypothetical protein